MIPIWMAVAAVLGALALGFYLGGRVAPSPDRDRRPGFRPTAGGYSAAEVESQRAIAMRRVAEAEERRLEEHRVLYGDGSPPPPGILRP